MEKLKAYIATSDYSDEVFKEIGYLIEECKEHIEIFMPKKEMSYAEKMDNLLSSQILVAYLDPEKTDYGVGCEVSIFASSLETLRKLNLSHTPKIIIGRATYVADDSFVLGFIGENGVMTNKVDATLDAMIIFYNNYPM